MNRTEQNFKIEFDVNVEVTTTCNLTVKGDNKEFSNNIQLFNKRNIQVTSNNITTTTTRPTTPPTPTPVRTNKVIIILCTIVALIILIILIILIKKECFKHQSVEDVEEMGINAGQYEDDNVTGDGQRWFDFKE